MTINYTTDWYGNRNKQVLGCRSHEQALDAFGLINMLSTAKSRSKAFAGIGRVCDPTIGRFMSADPIISDGSGLQGFNRYSYCTNNPLKYTDPSGDRQKPDGWNQPWVSNFWPRGGTLSGRMGPGSGNHWSDGFRSEWGNFMLGNQGAYDGMYGQGSYNNFVNSVYPKEKNQTSFEDRLLAHLLGFEWNPLGGVEVERKKIGINGINIYYSGSWVKINAQTTDQLGKLEEDAPGEEKKFKDGKWGIGTYLGGTFALGAGFTGEIGIIVDSKGRPLNYLSLGLAIGCEISAAGGAIVVPQEDFNVQDWLGDGLGASFNIPLTPLGIEYSRSLFNTNYHAIKSGAGIGLGGSGNLSYTIVLPVVPLYIWATPGHPH